MQLNKLSSLHQQIQISSGSELDSTQPQLDFIRNIFINNQGWAKNNIKITAWSQYSCCWEPPTSLKELQQNSTIQELPQRGQVMWLGPEGPKAPILGRHVSTCATIFRLRVLLYLRASYQCVNQYIRPVRQSACATIPLESGRI